MGGAISKGMGEEMKECIIYACVILLIMLTVTGILKLLINFEFNKYWFMGIILLLLCYLGGSAMLMRLND